MVYNDRCAKSAAFLARILELIIQAHSILDVPPKLMFSTDTNTTATNATRASGFDDRSGPLYAAFAMFSLSSMPEWLNLIIMGGIIEISRRLFYTFWGLVVNSCWVTISFDDEDTAYSADQSRVLLVFRLTLSLAQHGFNTGSHDILLGVSRESTLLRRYSFSDIGKARSVEATTSTYGINVDEIAIPGQEDDRLSGRKVSFKPGRFDSHRMWYKGRFAVVSRSHIASNYYRVKESVHIR